MASYLRNIVDERDIHLITEGDNQLFLNMRGRLRSNDSEFNYDDILRDGGAILVVDADDEEIAQIEALLSGNQTITAHDSSPTMDDDTRESVAVSSNRGQDQNRIELVEEELQIGKREVEGGAVRVRTYTVEQPVSEEIRLREERVNVERHPVDRPVSRTDEGMFQERTIEMTERREEPVVSKQARVVEEVIINKDVQERTETVSDTVRRQEVEIERGSMSGTRDYDQYMDRYREDFSTRYSSSGQSFDHYSPAYELGHRLASDQQYREYTWEELEPSARTYWERNHNKQGAWDQFREAAQHAWQSARGSSGSRRQSS